MSEIDNIKKILNKHEKRITDLENLLKSKPIPVSTDSEAVILDLINSGFFDKQKRYSEIIKKLKVQAKFDKKTNYTVILKKLTRENKLERKMVEHQWVYGKK